MKYPLLRLILMAGFIVFGLLPGRAVSGGITFDAERNPVGKPVVILKFDKGRSVYVMTKSGG